MTRVPECCGVRMFHVSDRDEVTCWTCGRTDSGEEITSASRTPTADRVSARARTRSELVESLNQIAKDPAIATFATELAKRTEAAMRLIYHPNIDAANARQPYRSLTTPVMAGPFRIEVDASMAPGEMRLQSVRHDGTWQEIAINNLGSTPAGRMDAVIEMEQRGMIDRDEARELLNTPEMPDQYAMVREAVAIHKPAPADPLDVEYDGVKLWGLLAAAERNSREEWPIHTDGQRRPFALTPAQREAVSAWNTAQLAARVAASKAADAERERLRVVVDLEDE